GVGTREAQRQMRGLGAGRGEAHPLGAADQSLDELSPAHLQFMASAPVRTERELAFNGSDNLRVTVTEQQRAVSPEVVDVFVAVDVPLAAAGGARGIDGVGQYVAAIVRQARRDDLPGLIVKRGRTARAGAILGLDLGICARLLHLTSLWATTSSAAMALS